MFSNRTNSSSPLNGTSPQQKSEPTNTETNSQQSFKNISSLCDSNNSAFMPPPTDLNSYHLRQEIANSSNNTQQSTAPSSVAHHQLFRQIDYHHLNHNSKLYV